MKPTLINESSIFRSPFGYAIIALMRAWNGMWLAGLVLWLAACGAANSVTPSPAAITPVTTPTPLITAPASPVQTGLAPTRVPEIETDLPITLTVWVPEDFAPSAELGGDVLSAQLAEFETAHPNVQIKYVLKASYGKGGIVDWLVQLHELMPDHLPDTAIVDSRELDVLQKQGLLHPLNRDLPSGAYWDLFQPAQTIAKRNNTWLDQPLVVETEHLVYDTRRIETPPATWEQVLATKNAFAFPADSPDAFMFQYLENGGTLASEHSASDTNVMQSILDYYQRARANGNLNDTTAVLKAATEAMPLFAKGQVPMAQVDARDFLMARQELPNALPAAIPTRDGRASSLVSSWSFVVLTSNPERQQAALDYLEWLNEPAHLGEWAHAAQMIPASKSAFAQTIEPQAYADLLWSLLENGIAAPDLDKQAPYADAWHNAVQAVLNGQLSPEDAAFRAIQTLSQ